MIHRRRSVIAAIAAGALAVASCGGSDEGSSADPETTSATATTAPATATPTTTPGPGGSDDGDDDSDAPPPSRSGTDETTTAGSIAPALPPVWQLTGPSIDGGTIDLAELSDRPVLLWFWAPF